MKETIKAIFDEERAFLDEVKDLLDELEDFLVEKNKYYEALDDCSLGYRYRSFHRYMYDRSDRSDTRGFYCFAGLMLNKALKRKYGRKGSGLDLYVGCIIQEVLKRKGARKNNS